MQHIDALSHLSKLAHPSFAFPAFQAALPPAEIDRWRAAQRADRHFGPIVQVLERQAPVDISTFHRHGQYALTPERLLVYCGRSSTDWTICVPRAMVDDMLRRAHEDRGHPGIDETLRNFEGHVPRKAHLVTQYVRHCPRCLQDRPSRRPPLGALQSYGQPDEPWRDVSVDFIVKLPASPPGTLHPFDTILTVIDRYSRKVVLTPGREDWTALQWAQRWHFLIMPRIGTPSRIVSDRDPRFTSHFWQDVHRLQNVDLAITTPYHPQANGLCERANHAQWT